jgi:membrane fusion protein (multidrug efflux system)
VDDVDSTAAIPVEMASAARGPMSAYYASTATLEAEEEAMVVAKVRGIAQNISVEEGDYIKAGELMATLEDRQLQIEASQAKATMDRLLNGYKRSKELYGRELISAEQFENAKFEYESQKAAYELAQLNVEYAQIQAPISGVISQRLIKKGNMVNTDQQVFKITDFDPLLAILHVPEHEMNKLKKGQQAVIRADAVQGETFTGSVLRISPVVNPETGTFKVTIAVRDQSNQLKPGMFGRVRIVYDTRENALMIPKEAVMSEDGASSVFVMNNRLVFRKPISTGYENGANIEVVEGLADGDSVVTIGHSSLQDSAKVQVVAYETH